MPVDPSPVILCARTWRPKETWAQVVRPAYETLSAGATGEAAVHAWCELAMMMGDSRAAPLALVVCLHAATEVPPGGDDRRLLSHRHLCLLDLGLAHADGPVRIKDLHDPEIITGNVSALEAWLARALIPFGCDVARAAHFALRVACLRVGILEGPDPTP